MGKFTPNKYQIHLSDEQRQAFGDITAKTEVMRIVVTVQMFLDLLLLGFGARAFVSAVQLGRKRRAPGGPADSS